MAEDSDRSKGVEGSFRELGEEGFVSGANLPWIDYGFDFGANAWRPEGGIGRPGGTERLDGVCRELALAGTRAVRWFLFCDGRAGITFDTSGRPQSVDDFVLRDIDAALAVLDRYRLKVMFALVDFHWCLATDFVNGVQTGGRADLLRYDALRASLLDVVFGPVLERYGQRQTIMAWDVMNEPEWIGLEATMPFLRDTIALVRQTARQPVTVGSAGARWRHAYQDLDLDFYQVHWYDGLKRQPALQTRIEDLDFDRPVILGEFPTCGSRFPPGQIIQTARDAGYAGAFYWSALLRDSCSDPAWHS